MDALSQLLRRIKVVSYFPISTRNTREIHFTMKEEKDGWLPFMDVQFTWKLNGELEQVFQKPTHANRYVHFTSHHPNSVKSGVIDCLINRATTVLSSAEILKRETANIVEVMRKNGYPETSSYRKDD